MAPQMPEALPGCKGQEMDVRNLNIHIGNKIKETENKASFIHAPFLPNTFNKRYEKK